MTHPSLIGSETIQTAWLYAARKHRNQLYPATDLPYLVHIGSVCLELFPALHGVPELDTELSLCCAILHDTVEDTEATIEELAVTFGNAVAAGVSALTKNKKTLCGKVSMLDSLARIQQQPREVWLVKLADRAANLGIPPAHWSREKCHGYAAEGELILRELGGASSLLAKRLSDRITAWKTL